MFIRVEALEQVMRWSHCFGTADPCGHAAASTYNVHPQVQVRRTAGLMGMSKGQRSRLRNAPLKFRNTASLAENRIFQRTLLRTPEATTSSCSPIVLRIPALTDLNNVAQRAIPSSLPTEAGKLLRSRN